jgi:sporulation protein YlmC with PRC-barrel domain
MVARPDLLLMIKRKDRFLAWDAFRVVDGRVIATVDHDSWDVPACKRLNIDWDECLILEGMPLVTTDGVSVGTIDAIEYNERTGKVLAFQVSNGVAARTLLGVSKIPLKLIVGYRDGRVVAKRAASDLETEGGLATKAGEQAAVVTHVVKEKTKSVRKTASEVGKKTGEAADKALDIGSRALGKQLGKSKGMFKAFKDEYKKGRGTSPKSKK